MLRSSAPSYSGCGSCRLSGIIVTIGVEAAPGRERHYQVPAADLRRACLEIADDILGEDTELRDRHWLNGRWDDAEDYLKRNEDGVLKNGSRCR